MLSTPVENLIKVDALAEIMMILVLSIGSLVWIFARRHLDGDRRYRSFSWQLISLCLSVTLLLVADNIALFFTAWCLSNSLLVLLMIHKPEWRAAKASGRLAAKNFGLGAFFLGLAFILIYVSTGQTSVHEIVASDSLMTQPLILPVTASLILLCAMTQSAIFPFHRWLLSSLNAPTPVSAIMHAGLINGGGFLLARFAPLYLTEINLLSFIFLLGLGSAILGTLWKLLQHDIKRMLACSTMAQMGLMLAQCGLGLFPAAIAHLCWHGLFKATLFLGASGAAQDKRLLIRKLPSLSVIALALFSGLLGSYCFALTSGKSWFVRDTSAFLVGLSFITTTQLALTLLQTHLLKNILIVAGLSCAAGCCYGWSVFLITWQLRALDIAQAQPLNRLHSLGFALLVMGWLATVLRDYWSQSSQMREIIKLIYVRQLNASQPDPSTITAHRQHYQF